MLPRYNPFSSRFVRPGAIPFLFLEQVKLPELVHQLEGLGGTGQIVGPHGSGKSTLLESLLPLLEKRTVRRFRFTLQQHSIPEELWQELPSSLLVIDGFEQLNWFARRRIRQHCKRHEQGLLITAHRDLGLPILYQAHITPELAQAVVDHLVVDTIEREALLKGYDLGERLKHHRGSMREVLFELYDRWARLKPVQEPRRSASG